MTIKSIKEKYATYGCENNTDWYNTFTTFDYNDGNGKVVIVVNNCRFKDIGKWVRQIIRVSDGTELLSINRMRPCDNLNDAIDVAWEMMQ